MELALDRRQTADGSYGSKGAGQWAVALAVALGGSLGALARYAVIRLVERTTLSVFPWDVFVVNATGCFLAGVAVAALVDRHETPEWLRVGLIVGFLGAYTTFSTFAQDTYDLGLGREYAEAIANVLASVGIGVVAVAAGTLVGRML